jgi:malonyl-CoA O-methyltransferase
MKMGLFGSAEERQKRANPTVLASPLDRAIGWVKANRIPGSGIRPHNKSSVHTMEVTGYLIPTLRDAGERELARDLARWEASVQAPDGSFTAPGEDVAYTFDTAQVIRGFLAMLEEMPELERNLRQACDYVAGQVGPDGRVETPSYDAWKLDDGTHFTEYAHLYVLPPLLFAGEKLNEQRYVEAARRGMEHFRKKPDLVEFKPEIGTLSHIFGYMMEALVEMGEKDLARKGLRQAAAVQEADGSIPAFPGARWTCSTGMAQLAVAWYKLGERGPANRAMDYLATLQNESGGFYGSYGEGARYFPAEEISWAPKYYIDAWLLRQGHPAR